MKNIINWKLFIILTVVCVITSFMVIPYTQALTSSDIEFTPLMLILTGAQNLVVFSIAVFCGLFFSQKVGLGLPILEGALNGEKKGRQFLSILLPSILLGILPGVLIVIFSMGFDVLIPEFQALDISIPVWKAVLASFYGGIGEEVLLRLFLVSLFVWLTSLIMKTKDGRPTGFGICLAIIISAIVFGLGHLPATAYIVPLTQIVIIRALVLNGIGGIIFGLLYWKKGLESAIIAHFTADIVLHVVTPLVTPLVSPLVTPYVEPLMESLFNVI